MNEVAVAHLPVVAPRKFPFATSCRKRPLAFSRTFSRLPAFIWDCVVAAAAPLELVVDASTKAGTLSQLT